MKRATIKDIAKALDVNPSTVSRALSDHPDISAAVKRAVKEMAAQLHYHPNHLAINLRKRRSRLIGLIIPEISMFFSLLLLKPFKMPLPATRSISPSPTSSRSPTANCSSPKT